MFFFFPFYAENQASSGGGGSSRVEKQLPLLPAPGSSKNYRASNRSWDFGDFAVDLLRQTLSAITSSLTALGNRANALFAQVAAALAFDRVARDTASFIGAAWSGFGAPQARPSFFGAPMGQPQDPMSFSPFLTQGFNPLSINPWAAFAEGISFWTNMWMPAAPKRKSGSFSGSPATPFMAKVSTPNGFSWGFAWGA